MYIYIYIYKYQIGGLYIYIYINHRFDTWDSVKNRQYLLYNDTSKSQGNTHTHARTHTHIPSKTNNFRDNV